MAKANAKKSVAKANAKKSVAKANAKKSVAKVKAKKTSAKKPAAKKVAVKAAPKKSVKPAAKKSAKPAAKTPAPKISAQAKKLAVSLAPLADRILVQVEKGERVTAGGLFIPDSATVSGNNRGLVVAVGKGLMNPKGRFRPTQLRAGDRILFAEYAGEEVELGSDKFKIMRETDVLGLVDSE